MKQIANNYFKRNTNLFPSRLFPLLLGVCFSTVDKDQVIWGYREMEGGKKVKEEKAMLCFSFKIKIFFKRNRIF